MNQSACTRTLQRFAWTTAILLGAACAPAIDVNAVQSPDVAMNRYRTFAFEITARAPVNYAVSPRSSRVQSHIEETATAILQHRGYAPAQGAPPDFIVRIESGRRPAARPPSPTEPGQTERQYGAALDNEAQDLTEGSFVLDVFDGRTHQLAWRGVARSVVDTSHLDYARLDRAVEKVLASFPEPTVRPRAP